MEEILNEQQTKAKDMIVDWFSNNGETKKQLFFLSGYAGTGKTFLINHIIETHLKLKPTEVAFGTPTGKAASVLIQRGRDASTIHKLIYTPEEEEYETKVNGNSIRSKRIIFKKRNKIADYKLIILDEVSMVDQKMMDDLLSFGIPLLCTGDPGQLPPINGENKYLEKPDYILTEIVRQSLDNPIIKLATMARNKEVIPYGNYGTVLVLDKNKISKENIRDLLLGADQIICGTNATRNKINDDVRTFMGIDISKDVLPTKGDKVICTVNNWQIYLDEDEQFNLVNGTIGRVDNVEELNNNINLGSLSFKADFLEDSQVDDIKFDTGIFKAGEFTYDMHQRVFMMNDGKFKLKKWLSKRGEDESQEEFAARVKEFIMSDRDSVSEEMINRFEFAYAISAHKSQGSEFDKIVVFEESYMFKDPEKWLYTAITRAKKKLVIIR